MSSVDVFKARFPEDFERAFAINVEYLDAISVVVRDGRDTFGEYFEPGAGFWLAVDAASEEIIGCVGVRPLASVHRGACEIKRMYVRPEHRGRGVADALLDALEACVVRWGYGEAFLDTKDDLHAAIRFYERRGYTRCTRYNDNPQATIFMSRRLSASASSDSRRLSASSPVADERSRVLACLRRWGRNVHAFDALEPGLSYWFSGDDDGLVAYARAGRWRVVVGSPICPRERLASMARDFTHEARRQGGQAVFFGVSDRFLEMLEPGAFDWVQIGMQPWWDPREWDAGPSRSDLRRRLRRAVRAGVAVAEVTWHALVEGAPLRVAAERLLKQWQRGHSLPPMRFMVTADLFTAACERRYFVATQGERLVGLLVGAPIYARGGWLLDDLIVERRAAPGASESLVDLAMRTLGAEGVTYASLGLVALAGLGKGRGEPHPHPVLDLAFNASLRWLRGFYSFQGIHGFRDKLRPTAWEPVYMAASPRVHVGTLLAVLSAFSGGGLVRFTLHALRRWVASAVTAAREKMHRAS